MKTQSFSMQGRRYRQKTFLLAKPLCAECYESKVKARPLKAHNDSKFRHAGAALQAEDFFSWQNLCVLTVNNERLKGDI